MSNVNELDVLKLKILLEIKEREHQRYLECLETPILELREIAKTGSIEEKALCERSLADFFVRAWPQIDTAEYKHNWHIDVICDHIQALYEGRIKNNRLIINIPPRFAKSLICSVATPAWIWTIDSKIKFLSASWAQRLTTRDNLKCRRLIQSAWYQKHWGDKVVLSSDQNEKMRFENTQGGYRIAISVGGGTTGDGGDFLNIDDPMDSNDAESNTKRQYCKDWYENAFSSRQNDPKKTKILLVMQRQHEDDFTAFLLEKGGWDHLVIPMEYEDDISKTTSIGWKDKRKPGELIWAERFNKDVVKSQKSAMSNRKYAGQYQQRPAAKEGNIFKVGEWRYYSTPPAHYDFICQSWDTAFKDGEENDYSALTTWGIYNRIVYLIDFLLKKLEFPQLKMCVNHEYHKHKPNLVLIEDHASGQSLIQELRLDKQIPFKPIKVSRDKVVRAHSITVMIEQGTVRLPKNHENIFQFIDIMAKFPSGKIDDLVDSVTMALNHISTIVNTKSIKMY